MTAEFTPGTEEMPPEFADPEGDAELDDPRLGLETRTSDLRQIWADWKCGKGPGAFSNPTFFGKRIGGVPNVAVDAFKALEDALRASGYSPSSSWAYNCRMIAGTSNYSLHSYGIAIDIDPKVNPFSYGDPYSGKIKASHVEAVKAIKNTSGRTIWAWGGDWKRRDRMHFQLDRGPNDVAVNWSTVPGGSGSSIELVDGAKSGTQIDEVEEDNVLTKGAEGKAVEYFQKCLLRWDPKALPEYGADGDYGSEMSAWVKKYQMAYGLDPTGNLDGVTGALLSAEGG